MDCWCLGNGVVARVETEQLTHLSLNFSLSENSMKLKIRILMVSKNENLNTHSC